jgi:hypothetical protein
MSDRPPRLNEYQKEYPDSEGEWFFTGNALVGFTDSTKSIVKMDIRRFLVIEKGGGFYPADPDTKNVLLGVKWVGWWVKIEDYP